jgi:hypothetical protein
MYFQSERKIDFHNSICNYSFTERKSYFVPTCIFRTPVTFGFNWVITLDVLASSAPDRMNKILSILYFYVAVKVLNWALCFIENNFSVNICCVLTLYRFR